MTATRDELTLADDLICVECDMWNWLRTMELWTSTGQGRRKGGCKNDVLYGWSLTVIINSSPHAVWNRHAKNISTSQNGIFRRLRTFLSSYPYAQTSQKCLMIRNLRTLCKCIGSVVIYYMSWLWLWYFNVISFNVTSFDRHNTIF